VTREIDEELQFHLDSRVEDLVRAGASPEAADREAQRRLGHPLLLRDRSRDARCCRGSSRCCRTDRSFVPIT
jgi:hypothetical protein